jgi:hypothetical protein
MPPRWGAVRAVWACLRTPVVACYGRLKSRFNPARLRASEPQAAPDSGNQKYLSR